MDKVDLLPSPNATESYQLEAYSKKGLFRVVKFYYTPLETEEKKKAQKAVDQARDDLDKYYSGFHWYNPGRLSLNMQDFVLNCTPWFLLDHSRTPLRTQYETRRFEISKMHVVSDPDRDPGEWLETKYIMQTDVHANKVTLTRIR